MSEKGCNEQGQPGRQVQLNVWVPASIRDYVRARGRNGIGSSQSRYLTELIRADQARERVRKVEAARELLAEEAA